MERFMMGVDMCDLTYQIVRNDIINKNPNYSEGEIVAAIIGRYYSDCFSEAELVEITKATIDFHDRK